MTNAKQQRGRGSAVPIVFSLALTALLVVTVTAFAQDQSEAAPAGGGLVVEDMTGTLTPADLVTALVGPGITVTNITYTGSLQAAGIFTGGLGIISFQNGIILSSGVISNVVGPNTFDGITGINSTPGDADLDALSGFTTEDAAVLEFDFVTGEPGLLFRYVFASDEYNEFVNSEFNDVFGFFINGQNCATVGGDPVSINTINNGNPFGTGPVSNPQLYINNDPDDPGPATINTEMDGLTVKLDCSAIVVPGVTNHMKLAIADASDAFLDSNVFLQAGSLISRLPPRSFLPIVTRNP